MTEIKKFTWLRKNESESCAALTAENMIELMKLNGFDFHYTHDRYHYFKKDRAEGFVTTDDKPVLALFVKGIKYSVLLPFEHMDRFFLSDRTNGGTNVYVDIFGLQQTFATK